MSSSQNKIFSFIKYIVLVKMRVCLISGNNSDGKQLQIAFKTHAIACVEQNIPVIGCLAFHLKLQRNSFRKNQFSTASERSVYYFYFAKPIMCFITALNSDDDVYHTFLNDLYFDFYSVFKFFMCPSASLSFEKNKWSNSTKIAIYLIVSLARRWQCFTYSYYNPCNFTPGP